MKTHSATPSVLPRTPFHALPRGVIALASLFMITACVPENRTEADSSAAETASEVELAPANEGVEDPRMAMPPSRDRIVPVTLGDAVIDFFQDRTLSAIDSWRVEEPARGVSPVQGWASVTVDFQVGRDNPGLRLRRDFAEGGLEIASYSQVVLSARIPPDSTLVLAAETDQGEFRSEFPQRVSHTDQFVLTVPGATRIFSIALEVDAEGNGARQMTLFWIGLRDPELAEQEKERWRFFTRQPLDPFLRTEPQPADLSPLYHLLASPEGMRQAADAVEEPQPLHLEADLQLYPHLGGANQNLFGRIDRPDGAGTWVMRSRETGRRMRLEDAAVAAWINGDVDSLREVAKAAIMISLVPHWDVDFVTDFPDSLWRQGAFQQSRTAYEVSLALDLAGAWMTRAGHDLVLRRLMESGLNPTNLDLWVSRHRHESNQLPVFTMGRLAVYRIMEQQQRWAGTATGYTDLAYKELMDSLAHIFNEDGGFFEGSGYLAFTLRTVLPAFAIYANARGGDIEALLPSELKGTGDYLEAIRSTTGDGTRLIYLGSGQGGAFTTFPPSLLSVLAKMRPGGTAARMLAALPSEGRVFDPWALPAPDLQGVDPNDFEPWVRLPVSGLLASTRKLDEEWVKFLLVGNSTARRGHFQEDRGSFVLEFAGETFAADPGGLNYSESQSPTMLWAQHHNMLVPAQDADGPRPAPIRPHPIAVVPDGEGDEVRFEATINPGVLWPNHYREWVRSVNAPSPGEITITDRYERIGGGGVDFLWHTPLPVREQDGTVVIEGARGTAVVHPPEGASIHLIPARRLGTQDLSTIRFHVPASRGVLHTRIILHVR